MDRSITDGDLDFWFNEVDALMGERSTMSSTMSMLQRGGATSGQYEEPFADLKLWVWHLQHDRIQRVKERLLKLSRAEYRLLEVHYTSIAGVGDAKNLVVNDTTRHEQTVLRLRARFGDLAAVVVHLAEKANVDLFGTKNASTIDDLVEKAERELKTAHRAWRATRPKKDKDGPKLEVPEAPLSHVA